MSLEAEVQSIVRREFAAQLKSVSGAFAAALQALAGGASSATLAPAAPRKPRAARPPKRGAPRSVSPSASANTNGTGTGTGITPERILEAMPPTAAIAPGDLARVLDTNPQELRRKAMTLVAEGKIKRTGKGRAVLWARMTDGAEGTADPLEPTEES